MFCKKCGNQIPDTANFCGKCGTVVDAPIESAKTPKTAQSKNQKAEPVKVHTVINSKNKIIAVISIVLVIAMAAFYIKQGEKEKAVAILEEGQNNISTDAMTDGVQQAGQNSGKPEEKETVQKETQPAKSDDNTSKETQPQTSATEMQLVIKAVCNGNEVNCRKAPSTDAEVFFTINEGTVLHVYELNSDNWYRVKDDYGNEFWIFGEYVTLLEIEDKTSFNDTNATKSETTMAKVGQYITFGRYEQDRDTGNGAEPIEWLVLDKQGDRMLVISRYALDCQPYNTKSTDVTWETCTLRSWLNTEFYNTAFDDREKTSVITTTVNNPNNAEYGTNCGNATKDKVFCLSIDEANRYFSSDEAREAEPTSYTVGRGVYVRAYIKEDIGNCSWWLRSSGSSQINASRVEPYGTVNNYGSSVNYASYAVRPALWIAVNP